MKLRRTLIILLCPNIESAIRANFVRHTCEFRGPFRAIQIDEVRVQQTPNTWRQIPPLRPASRAQTADLPIECAVGSLRLFRQASP